MVEDVAFRTIATPPPPVEAAAALELAGRHYGIEASARPLTSERDANFLLTATDGSRFVMKIANAAEDRQATAFQIAALLHVESAGLPLPRIRRTLDGASSFDLDTEQGSHTVRLVSFLDGILLEDIGQSVQLARCLGKLLGRVDRVLEPFRHPGETQAVLWDINRAGELARFLPLVADADARRLVTRVLEDFEIRVRPLLDELPWQVIHNDANPANVLASPKGDDIAGIIDFGDMLRAPRIFELAVAGAYQRAFDDDPLALVAPLVSGYASAMPVADAEIEVLPALIRTRLAATVLILEWRRSLRGAGDDYLTAALESERTALPFLRRLDELGDERATAALRRARDDAQPEL